MLVAALLALGAAAATLYAGRVAPAVTVAGVEVGLLTRSEAGARLAEAAADARISVATDELSVDLDDRTGIGVDVAAMIDEAFAAGIGEHLAARWRIADRGRFDAAVGLLASAVEQDAIDGDVWIDGDVVAAREARAGTALDRPALLTAVLAADTLAPRIAAPLRIVEPGLDANAVAEAYDAARNASLPLVLVAGSERTVIEPSRLLPMVSIVRVTDGDGERLDVRLDDAMVDALARDAALALDGAAREAVLVPGDERLRVVAGRDEVVVDRALLRARIAEAIVGGERVFAVPADVTHPGVTTEAAQRTSDALVLAGGYTTYFPVNWARATNIGAAARTFDGMTVAPGESFSFWDRIGEVSPRTGYVVAGTIIGGVSSEAIGGGLCQVSTTFFNAVASAGYQIDERHPHSYYIERYPLGLDAAVFAPSTDMRWTNDTAVTALVRAEGTDTSVSFWIYSPPLGRTVTFGDVRQWNLRWPSADQPADPGHVPGYVVPGRDTTATRTVTENGTVIHQDTWYSHYAPVWGGPAR